MGYKNNQQMKIILIPLLLLYLNAFSQNDTDSLSKYSYLITGDHIHNGSIANSGTCFFIRKNSRIFLVTAKHVVSGCQGANKDSFYNKALILSIKDSTGIPKYFTTIDISKIADTCSCVDSTGDIIAFEFVNKFSNMLLSVENFIMPKFKNTGDVNIYGFPGYKINGVSDSAFRSFKTSHIYINRKETVFGIGNYRDSEKFDSTALLMINKNLVTDRDTMQGFSGSPVFIKELNSNRIRVIGAFSTSNHDLKNDFRAYGVAYIEHAIDQINNQLR
jgi:V8-like Glu-specific endopeptidase